MFVPPNEHVADISIATLCDDSSQERFPHWQAVDPVDVKVTENCLDRRCDLVGNDSRRCWCEDEGQPALMDAFDAKYVDTTSVEEEAERKPVPTLGRGGEGEKIASDSSQQGRS